MLSVKIKNDDVQALLYGVLNKGFKRTIMLGCSLPYLPGKFVSKFVDNPTRLFIGGGEDWERLLFRTGLPAAGTEVRYQHKGEVTRESCPQDIHLTFAIIKTFRHQFTFYSGNGSRC